jgi:hypothetical protein
VNLFKKKKKYYAVYCLREVGVQTIIAIKRINPTKKSVSFRGNTFVLDITTPSYTKGTKVYYFFSISDKQQLTFSNDKEPLVNTELIDSILSQKIIEQLTKNLNNDFKMNIMTLMMGVIIGALVGYMYATYTSTQTPEVAGLLINFMR